MEYKNLGHSGLQVSLVGLGCNNLGRTVDVAQAELLVNACLEEGVNFFDTADVYGNGGGSEEVLGKVLKPHRRDVVLATKGGSGRTPLRRGGSRRHLMQALEDSLRRLDTDYVDLYQLHSPDARTPIEETLRAMEDMIRSGKVRYVGCSNFKGWQVVEAYWTARTHNLTPFISAQNEYSLLKRDIEAELAPASLKYGLGLLPYYPLASGLLTGKYTATAGQGAPEGTRLSHNFAVYGGVYEHANFDVIRGLENFAQERGHTIVELAMSWLAVQPFMGCIIAGATKPEQVRENARAVSWKLTHEDLKEIDLITGVSSA